MYNAKFDEIYMFLCYIVYFLSIKKLYFGYVFREISEVRKEKLGQ